MAEINFDGQSLIISGNDNQKVFNTIKKTSDLLSELSLCDFPENWKFLPNTVQQKL